MKKLTATALACVVLGGCTTLDPYTREQQTSNATKGAGIGAVAGAVLGSAVSGRGDRTKGAVIGALVGAGAGGGIGHYMDQQEALLRQELDGSGVGVERVGDEIRLIMPGHITFQTNAFDIAPSFHNVLNAVVRVLQKFDKTLLSVAGFTDSTGSFEYNQTLSERRAASVASYLANGGVSAARISTQGYGERYPVADNGTEQGRAMNRRVEINIRGSQG